MAIPSQQPANQRSGRAARKRQRILDAAGQCFAANGFGKTTVEEIAMAAGVSKSLIYNHFRGKDELLEAVLERTLSEWSRVSGTDLLTHADSVLEGLAVMHRSALAYARENPVLRALLSLDPIVLMGEGNSAVRRSMQEFRGRLVESIARGVERGELREDLNVAGVADVIRVLHLAFVEHLLDPKWIDGSDEALVEAGIDLIRRGIARSEP
jgi:AcrR family transcriptional regulator